MHLASIHKKKLNQTQSSPRIIGLLERQYPMPQSRDAHDAVFEKNQKIRVKQVDMIKYFPLQSNHREIL